MVNHTGGGGKFCVGSCVFQIHHETCHRKSRGFAKFPTSCTWWWRSGGQVLLRCCWQTGLFITLVLLLACE